MTIQRIEIAGPRGGKQIRFEFGGTLYRTMREAQSAASNTTTLDTTAPHTLDTTAPHTLDTLECVDDDESGDEERAIARVTSNEIALVQALRPNMTARDAAVLYLDWQYDMDACARNLTLKQWLAERDTTAPRGWQTVQGGALSHDLPSPQSRTTRRLLAATAYQSGTLAHLIPMARQ